MVDDAKKKIKPWYSEQKIKKSVKVVARKVQICAIQMKILSFPDKINLLVFEMRCIDSFQVISVDPIPGNVSSAPIVYFILKITSFPHNLPGKSVVFNIDLKIEDFLYACKQH